MEFLKSMLYSEVQTILQNQESKTNYTWITEIYYNDVDFIVPLKTVAVINDRDYENNYSDEIVIHTLIPMGQYEKKIYPNRNNIKIVLKKKQLGEQVSNNVDYSSTIIVGTYTGLILNEEPSATIGKGNEADSQDALDLKGFLEIKFQLLDTNIEKIRTIQTGGSYNRFKIENLLKSVLVSVSNGLLKGFSINKPDNDNFITQLLIPHGTLLVDLPGFIQNKIGIFNSGLCSYIQDGYWFINYLYNVNKLDDRKDTINVIVVPSNKLPNIERSYKNVNGDITILVSGNTEFSDDNGINNVVEGQGARLSNADKLFDGSGIINKGNKTLMSRAKVNSEFLAYGRESNINFAPSTTNKIQNNSFVQFSAINRRTGGFFKGIWQSADDTLLKPCTPAKITYCDEDGIKTIKGILVSAKYISMMKNGIVGESYNNQAMLTFYVNKIE